MNDAEITDKSIEILIIRKPDFAGLLRVSSDIRNKENTPKFDRALWRISDASSLEFGRDLVCDTNESLVDIDLSHLDFTGTIHLESVPQSARSMNLSFNDFETLDHDGLGSKLDRLKLEIDLRSDKSNLFHCAS